MFPDFEWLDIRSPLKLKQDDLNLEILCILRTFEYSGDPKARHVWFSNSRPQSDFRMVQLQDGPQSISLDRFIYKNFFFFIYKTVQSNLPSEYRISKMSSFRMNPVFKWSDFGSIQYWKFSILENYRNRQVQFQTFEFQIISCCSF